MLEVEIFKIVDAGHFWCKPSSRNRTEAEKYYTLSGKINDYCCKTQTQSSNQKSKIPSKGKICLVKRTSDKCWHRAKVLSVFQTMNGPQARVLLVDLGERTLVPGIWVQEIPEEFLNIPYQTMECVLSGLKPLSMVTSYFDLTTKKQPGDTWDVSATEWFKKQITGCSLQLDVKHIDDDGVHHVFLFATGPDSMVCLNDELMNREYAILSKSTFEIQDEKQTNSSKSQDTFSEELKNLREKFNNSLSMNEATVSSPTTGRYQPLTTSGVRQSKYEPLTWSDESVGSGQESGTESGKQPISAQFFSSDQERGKVRSMSARLPATGTGSSLVYQPMEVGNKQPKPILKHSSGYSSSDDPHRDSRGSLQKPEGERLKGYSPAFAHHQNVNLTNKHDDTNLNSNVYDSQPGHPQRRASSREELPRYVGGPPNHSAHQQRAVETRQSQNVPPSSNFHSGLQYGQNIASAGSTLPRRNIQNENVSSQDSYQTSSSNQQRLTYEQNIPSAGSTLPRRNIQNENQTVCDDFPSINNQLHQQPTSQAQSTDVPNAHWQQSHFHPAPQKYQNVSTNPGQSTSVLQSQQQRQNSQRQQSQYTSNSPSKYLNASSYQEQSKGISPLHQQNTQYVPTNTSGFPHQPSNQARSTGVPLNQAQQQNLAPRQSTYPYVSSNEKHFPNKPKRQSSHYDSTIRQQSTNAPTGIVQSQDIPSNTQCLPTRLTRSSRIPNNQVQSHYNATYDDTNLDTNVYDSQPGHPQRRASSREELPRYVGGPPSHSAYQQRAVETRQSQNVPPSSNFHSGQQYGQNIASAGSTIPRRNIQNESETVSSQDSYQTSSSNQQRLTYGQNIPSAGSTLPRRNIQNENQTVCDDFPSINNQFHQQPTSQAQSTDVPNAHWQQSHFHPAPQKYQNVSTNPGESTGVLQSQQQRQNSQQQQSQYTTNSSSKYLNAPSYQEQSKGISSLHQQNTQYVTTNTSGFPHQPSNQARSTGVPLNQAQQQNLPPRQSNYPYVSSNQKHFPNEPISQSSQIVHDSTIPQQSIVPTGMVQSQDIPRNTPCLPTGQTPSSRIPNNQVATPSTQNSTTLYPTQVPESTTQSTSIQARPSMYQQTPNNQDQSPLSSKHPTSVPSTSHTSHIPKSPVQSSFVQRSPTKSPRIPSSPMPNAKLCNVTKGVFEHGEGLPKSFTDIDSTTFPIQVQRGLRDLGVTKPNSFQASIWAIIMRGRDVFGIAESSSANAMAYLAPVITLLTDPAAYSELPLGMGPLALILCEGWRKATTVYEQCRKLTKNVRNVRVQIIYGAGAEDECIAHLINGCEILIATPACLLRMLTMKVTSLNRLCHLVFDDADILAEEQTECIKELMREYTALLKSQPNRQAPRQCIALGNKWSTGVSSLVRVYLENPLIVIGNLIEAAMFCKVRQIVNYVSSSKRDSELLNLLDKYTLDNEHEIIVFTSTTKDAEHLAEMLQYYSFTILLAHEFLWPEQLIEVRRQWNTPHSSNSFLILIMTDGVIDKCNIRTASCVIHYDPPPSKKLFGKRLFCMAASYPSTKERECLSVTIGTEHSTGCARNMKELAFRSSGAVPPTLEKVCEFSYQEKEEKKKNDDLCSYLKAFGHCKDLLQCKNRHTVFPDVDVSALLPKSGFVKVLILAVVDASRYFVRILEHRIENKKAESSNYYTGATFLKLALDLNAFYTSRDNRHVCSRIDLDKLCVVVCEESYCRAKIIRVARADPETNKALEVQVYFLDRGFYEVISTRNLFEIAPQFVDIPYQAVEAYMCRIKPLDNDSHWTNKAVRFVTQHVQGQELAGTVVMGLRNTIWLDALVVQTHLKGIDVTVNTFNVRLDLLKEGLAVPNQEHVENLKKHFTSFVQLKDMTGCEAFERSPEDQQTCSLTEQCDEMVRVSSILNPELLYVRLDVNSNSIEDLLDKINDEIETQSAGSNEDLGIGSLCLAKFTEDERWYRAKVLSIRPEGEFDVFFVDYGDREWISQDRIAPIRPEYLPLPFQAIECSLVNISPVAAEWTEDDTEALWKLTEDKLLWAKVQSTSAALLSGKCRYNIVLTDTSTDRDVIVNHELVNTGHAQATLEYYKTLFPEAFETDNTGQLKEQFEEIPALCLQLHRSQDPNVKLNYAQEIKNIVSENIKKKDEIRESGGIRCICRLLGVTRDEAVQEWIVISLAFLATQNDLNCEEIRREGGLKILCDLLNKAENVKVQEHVAWALKHLGSSERNRDTTREIGGIKSLCHLLATTTHEKVQENICWAIVSLCSDNNKNCDAIREAGGLDTLLVLLETTRNNFVLENTMWAISLLTYNASNKRLIGEQGGIEKIWKIIETNKDEKILQNAIRSLKTLASYNDENRMIMCRLGVIDLMRRLSNSESQLPFDTRRTCLDLIQRLLGRAPDVPLLEASSITSPLQEPIRCKPISVSKKRNSISCVTQRNGKIVNGRVNSDDDMSLLEGPNDMVWPRVHPMTMWSQTKRFISLSIKLRDVQEKSSNITEKTFYFRTRHMEKLYELNLELFAEVIPKESKVDLRGSEVLVNLKKAQPAIWPRLLSNTAKPPFLYIDFDRWDTYSGSDDENETEPRVPTKRENEIPPLPFDDSRSESSESLSDEDLGTREHLGLDFAF